MSYIDGNRPAPFGAITIFRAATALGDLVDSLRRSRARRAAGLTRFTPAQMEDLGLSVGDMTADRRPGILSAVAIALREWDARRRTVAALERLTDSQLDDVGLTRADIEDLRFARR